MNTLLTKSAKIISSIVFINLAFTNNSHASTAKVTTKKLDLVTKKQCHKNKCDRLMAQTEQPNRDRFIQPITPSRTFFAPWRLCVRIKSNQKHQTNNPSSQNKKNPP